ncbi:MAG TPA: hypothetical protein VJ809_01430 [Pirellulales bacterium]|nr:hypothetical protein [Pirellulales bacterium]
MKHYTGDRLYIALPAAQVRRRLKGHGFGVKKIHSAGRGQAAVIHTATGEHLRQLKQLFADVRVADSEAELTPREPLTQQADVSPGGEDPHPASASPLP